MENLNGKRLLILGGSNWRDAIADYAKDNGIVLVAASNDPEAKFFQIAQETYVVNSTDANAMKALVRDKNIDGVYMGSHEFVVTAACDYVRELGLPCYCTRRQWDTFRNKDLFKEFCLSAGLPVVPQIKIDTANISDQAEALPWPIVTKPADSCGSAGFSVCNNAEEFLAGYKRARDNSQSGKVLVEKFMKNDMLIAIYTFSEGKVIFSGMDRLYNMKYIDVGTYVAECHIFEDALKDTFRERFEDKLIKAFNSIDLQEGILWFEIFLDGDEFYFNEAGYRYFGSGSVYPVDYFYGINQVGADIHYALTGKSCIYGHRSLIPDSLPRKKFYAIYNLHMKSGTISKITGLEEFFARKNAVFVAVTKSVGDTVEHTGTFGQIFAHMHFVFDSREEFIETVNDIRKKIIIEDSNGNNLANVMIDLEKTSDFFVAHEKQMS